MTSDTEVKDVNDPDNAPEPELLVPLPVGAHPASIRSLSQALQELQSVARRAQYVSIVQDRPNASVEKTSIDAPIADAPISNLTEYALSQQTPGIRATSEREASRLYAGAKLFI